MFTDFAMKQSCHITDISRETNQKYFGLNCLDSIVKVKSKFGFLLFFKVV